MRFFLESGPDISQVLLHFRASFQGHFRFHRRRRKVKKGQKSKTAFVGVGDRKASNTGEIFVFEGFQNDGRRGGGPEDFVCYRILPLFELIYGYSMRF